MGLKARVIATGDIVEISEDCSYVYAEHFDKSYNIKELEFLDVKEKSFPKDDDYWTRLEHKAAIAAMQGLCANPQYPDKSWDAMATDAAIAAHALVEKYKKEE